MTQCKSCGGFCKKSGCERTNIKPASSMTRTELIADLRLNHEYCPKEVILLAAETIDALVAENERITTALAERDAEIQRQYACIASHARITQAAEAKVEAQRKVLEQALETLNMNPLDTPTHEYDKKYGEAITAIQEVLPCSAQTR